MHENLTAVQLDKKVPALLFQVQTTSGPYYEAYKCRLSPYVLVPCLYSFHIFPIHATCLSHVIHAGLIIAIISILPFLLPLKPTNLSQHFILRHPQTFFFFQCQRSSLRDRNPVVYSKAKDVVP